jgi:DNA invertase Pin-like site-specific DNA recombinase
MCILERNICSRGRSDVGSSRVFLFSPGAANQERELRQVAERAGWQIVHVYRDYGISGTKGKDKRPAFNALHKAAARREFDVVMAWSVDRLGRSLQDLVGFLSEIHAVGVDLFFTSKASTPRRRVARRCFRCSASLPSGAPFHRGG